MVRPIVALIAGLLSAVSGAAQPLPTNGANAWSADANGPGHFVAVHGQRSAIIGYSQSGLEIWAYPLQLMSGYQLRFHEAGRLEPFDGQALLSRTESSPSEVVRVYNGPDFVVREHLFVPLDAPSAVITYEVEGRPEVQIEARFEPSLNLMWPGALGGQDVGWNEARSGYVEREPVHGFSAVIRSPQAIGHDPTVNSATNRPTVMGLLMEPRREEDSIRRARLVIAEEDVRMPVSGGSGLEDQTSKLRAQTDAHYASVLKDAVEIITPDPDVNRALAASIIAVEEAWVCAPQIGCGIVAGYGPSRPARRPQYAWYFAGDGLIAVESLLAAGRYERARDELEFIAKYQNKTNGMIWHEISTSAPLIDWEKRYPYMYVHVDITLQYLSALADYVETTGDTAFVGRHWAGIQAAWRYARSLVDATTGLPSIPAGKEGQNEQTVLRDDVSLSSAWVDATKAFGQLARVQHNTKLAQDADKAHEIAIRSLRSNYWDEKSGFWFGGHSASGEPFRQQRPDAAEILLQGAFTKAQIDQALDRLATPDYQTDWGVRSLSALHPDYDPNTYSSGAVWGLGSSGVSTIFWKEHRPFTAWNAWHGLVPWTMLDSPGHMHEVLAGDLFHPELESVPEQTWSSASFLSGAVHGLFGLDVQGSRRFLTFAPHLPASWNKVVINRLRVGSSRVDLHVTEDSGAIMLEIDNPGMPITVDFEPEIPLGARLTGAEVNNETAPATVLQTMQDQHVKIVTVARTGATLAVVRYSGGVRIAPVETAPRPGDKSINLKLVSAHWNDGDVLRLSGYAVDPAHAAIDLITTMKIATVQGADVTPIAKDAYRLVFHLPASVKTGPVAYVPVQATAKLERARPTD
ncbi:MAG TPA: hypothetical protein VGU01_07435 [Sphingomicrobium sp.]|nr:hypothetical protein [Sphingomicrobium sp.]